MAWWLWVVMGVVLLVVEMATPGGLFAIFFGIGAFLIAPVAALGAPTWIQWMLYTAVSLVMLASLRGILAQRLKARGSGPVDSLVGETATLLEDLAPGGESKAELRGSSWNARAVDGAAIVKGRRCHVERVEGLTLWLRAE